MVNAMQQCKIGEMRVQHNVIAQMAADGGYEITLHYGDAPILTADMGTALLDALAQVPETARFVILRSMGDDFCAGRQSPMPPAGTKIGYSGLRARVAEPVLDMYARLRDLPLPLITVVKGRAFGVGCALAALGDLVLADDSARFAVPEMDKDIPPLLVMTALADRLPRAGLARLVLTRQPIGAQDAVAMGLASHAVADVDAALADIRAGLAQNSPVVLATVKRFLNIGPELSFAQRRDYAATANPAAASEKFL